MADDEIQSLRQLLEDEKRRRQEAEQAQRASEQARRELEEQIRPLTLYEYLDACHTYLFGGLLPGKPDHSTKGNADNADGKLRPHRIREWLPFADAQTKIWARLLNDENEKIDLRYFQRDAITAPVGSVIEVFFENEQLRQLFGLQGQISFENHANTLTISEEDEGVVARPSKLRKGTGGAATPTNPPSSARPLADEFCIYNKGENVKIPALIGELKPPHKLPLAIIQNGLQDMELAGIVERHHDETEEIRHRRLVAAVITQAFSYMIKAGVEYGYVSTGETFIFLHFKADEPGTVYYYLSVPEQDVGKKTGFTGEADDDDNRLHMTAVGQVLAFALRAIKTTPHDQKWKDWAATQLNMWVVTEEDLYLPTPEKDEKPPTPYRPLKSAQIFVRNSPVRTRSKAAWSTCKPTSLSQKSSGEGDNDSESDPDSPSQRPRRPADVMVVLPPPPNRVSSYKWPVCKDGTRRYCTQKCLLGLLNGGPLDRACPNAKEHGTEVHKIDHTTFLSLLMAQILQEIGDPWTQPLGCESLHRHGARGALFEVILFQYGYTLVGKGFPPEFGHYLRHEKALYNQLQPIQGVHIPVCLGTIDVSKRPMFYDGIADIPHFLLLAHAGIEVSKCDVAEAQIVSAASEALQAIHALGVLHHDAETRNMFWSVEGENVLVIDFERADILRPERAPLGNTSPNQKRKRGSESMGGETKLDVRQKQIDAKFGRELKAMVQSLNTYLKS
ncbi:hypothetical protein PAAG_04655 [Paracoccidioides lutzii Pb01]|uniref:Protein kinase domain-containing protein n=1 Tax=Paracoccidioides lutzii (strain ATCC MYA-826 / Pb01) TaxID=502779 RepID=C1H1L1_PARBA|nr:hypothetical protein PAAG_04655 [Paracoccidioides lutzii Pb01]EEH33605.2 hypothetical protein PAAG_04655 [Paracoccidioides lutzii Pb01]